MNKKTIKTSGVPKDILAAAWAIALGAIAPMLDSTMINIALQQLTADFHTSLHIIQWSITGYVLALAIAVPISGWLINQYNGKSVFIGAVIAFGVISVLVGVSWSSTIFIGFRLLQGFSAGIITTLMSILLVKTAGKEYLGRVMAIVSTPMIFGPILGPVIGGFIIEAASWQWIFFINVFIMLIVVPFMVKAIPSFEPFNKRSKLDLFGIINLSFMSVALIYGIAQAGAYSSFNNKETIAWGSAGLLLAVIYLIYNAIQKNQTVLPLNLFRSKSYAASSGGLFLAHIAIMGPMIIFPLFFQQFYQFTPIQAALALMPQGIGMLVVRPWIGKMIDQIGARYVVLASLILALVSSIPLIFVTDHTPMIWMDLILFVRGTSVGGIILPLTSDAYTGLGQAQLAEAGVGITIIENLGTSFGSAILATVVASAARGIDPAVIERLQGYHTAFLVSVLVLLLICVPGLMLTYCKTAV